MVAKQGAELEGSGHGLDLALPGNALSWGPSDAELTCVNVAQDAERDGDVDLLHDEFLSQGAEKPFQGELSCSIGSNKWGANSTWNRDTSGFV